MNYKEQAAEHIRKLAQWAAVLDYSIERFRRTYIQPKEVADEK